MLSFYRSLHHALLSIFFIYLPGRGSHLQVRHLRVTSLVTSIFPVPIIRASAQSPSQCGFCALNPQARNRQQKCHSSRDRVGTEAAGDIATPLLCGLRGCHCKTAYLSLFSPNLASAKKQTNSNKNTTTGHMPFPPVQGGQSGGQAGRAPLNAAGLGRSPSPWQQRARRCIAVSPASSSEGSLA